MYKISMILPIFNVENYLDISMDSLINQTIGFENIEVILVDDCSTDGSRDIIQKYVDNYDNCKKLFLSENSGNAGKPRNEGIKIATAPYLMFLDPDDIYSPNACEKFYNEIIENDVDFVYSNHVYDSYGVLRSSYHPFIKEDTYIEFKNNENIKDYHKYFKRGIWSAIYNRKFIIDNSIFCGHELGEDLYFFLLAIFNAKKLLFLATYSEGYILKVRDNGDNLSITNIRDVKNFKSRLSSVKLLLGLLNFYGVKDNYYVLKVEFKALIIQFYTFYTSVPLYQRKYFAKEIYDFEKDIYKSLDLGKFFSILNFFIINKLYNLAAILSYILGFIYNNKYFRKSIRKTGIIDRLMV